MKSKSVFAIISTLIIGIVMGMLISSYMHHRKMKKFRSYSSFESFKFHFVKVLDPTEEQKEKILPIIEEFSRKNQELKIEYRKDFVELMNVFKEELNPLLTKEQIERLENMRKNRTPRDNRDGRGHGGKRRSGSGPPPPPFFND